MWTFFTAPVAASTARALGMALVRRAIDACGQTALSSYDRLFPAQDFLPTKAKGSFRFGSLIAPPLHGVPRDLAAFLDLRDRQVGSLGGGKDRRTHTIDLIMRQTLSHRDAPDALLDGYGLVIVDECHAVGAPGAEAGRVVLEPENERRSMVLRGAVGAWCGRRPVRYPAMPRTPHALALRPWRFLGLVLSSTAARRRRAGLGRVRLFLSEGASAVLERVAPRMVLAAMGAQAWWRPVRR